MTNRIVEITQDAAAILEKNGAEQGVYTDNVTSCIIYALETDTSSIVIHDSGQLARKDFIELLKSKGKPKNLYTLWPTKDTADIRAIKKHRDRYRAFLRVLKLNEKYVIKHTTPFSYSYSATYMKNSGLTATSTEPRNLDSINEKLKRKSIVELNNNFSPLGKEALTIDIQYEDGKYQPIKKINQTIEEIFYLLQKQSQYYKDNIYFLLQAHNHKAICLDENFLKKALCDKPPRDLNFILQNSKLKSKILT